MSNNILKAPCVFCDYSGPEYWQSGSHKEDCPCYTIGGGQEREDQLRSMIKEYCTIKDDTETAKEIMHDEITEEEKKEIRDTTEKVREKLYKKARKLSKEFGGAPVVIIVGDDKEAKIGSTFIGHSYKRSTYKLRHILGILQAAIIIHSNGVGFNPKYVHKFLK